MGLRQVLATNGNGNRMVKSRLEDAPMLRPPGHRLPNNPAKGCADWAKPPDDLEGIAPDKSSGQVGFIEFLTQNATAVRPLVALQWLIEDTRHHGIRMEHQ